MLADFDFIANHWPTGMIVADEKLGVIYANEFVRQNILGVEASEDPGSLKQYAFFTTDLRRFNMDECMRSMITEGRRLFHKTLIVKSGSHDKLVFFSVRSVEHQGRSLFFFNVSDISDEMDCIVHAPGSFGMGDFALRKKIIGHDRKIGEIFRMISLAAETDVNVLIQGESGTGKELVADAVHELSHRSHKPLVKVNCSALSETLLESELFGHVKGAFTGAYKDKTGKFEQAQGGTIFLDEIGEISPSLQVKLLRVLQEKVIEKVGDNTPVKVDMRIVAATNKDLRQLIRQNLFREDLFYRLNVFNIHMPALRERHLDIPLLAEHFIEKFNDSFGKSVKGLSRQALKILMDYSWPGNIRELQNALEHAFVLVQGSVIEPQDLPAEVQKQNNSDAPELAREHHGELAASVYYAETIKKNRSGRLKISCEQLESILEMHEWNQSKTAEYLGISRVALWKKMKKMELNPAQE